MNGTRDSMPRVSIPDGRTVVREGERAGVLQRGGRRGGARAPAFVGRPLVGGAFSGGWRVRQRLRPCSRGAAARDARTKSGSEPLAGGPHCGLFRRVNLGVQGTGGAAAPSACAGGALPVRAEEETVTTRAGALSLSRSSSRSVSRNNARWFEGEGAFEPVGGDVPAVPVAADIVDQHVEPGNVLLPFVGSDVPAAM